jgi:hypothetical protein
MVDLIRYPRVVIKPFYCARIIEELRKCGYKGLFIYDFASEELYITDSKILTKINEEQIPYEYITNPNSIQYILDEEGD